MNRLHRIIGLAAIVLLTPSLSADDRARDAIQRGVAYLQRTHGPQAGYTGGEYRLGSASLCGLAMLEGGAPANDPSVANVAQLVRATALNSTETYHVSLAVLFLDKLKDPQDEPLIQMLGVRLWGAMTAYGGWTYQLRVLPVDPAQFAAAIQNNDLVGERGKGKGEKPKADDGFPTARKGGVVTTPGKLHPLVQKYFDATRAVVRSQGRDPPVGDNSNTQFGLIGLWVSRRHGVPVDDALSLIESRFLSTQNKDYGWGYNGMAGDRSIVTMTCAGVLGLGVSSGRNMKSSEAKDLSAKLEGRPKAAVSAGLAFIAAYLPGVSKPDGLPGGGPPGPNSSNLWGGGGDVYYMLWSVERVAMAFGLKTIGQVDWYKIGADVLIPSQGQDGSWSGGNATDVSTAFAVLFLTRSNVVSDLTSRLGGDTELRSGPPNKGPQMPGLGAGPPAGGPPMPPPAPPAVTGDKIADGLLAASGAEWSVKLVEARDTKGSEFTTGLSKAIPLLDAPRQKDAREALTDRLTRMTANTLRGMLKGDSAEVRRSACLAVAYKEEKALIPDVIEKITDPVELVVLAAKASLKSMTEQDFGPAVGSDEAARAKAKADWLKWYQSQKK